MYAAAAGKSNLGIPTSVGKEFISKDDTLIRGAGIALMTPKGKVLFIKRSPSSNHPDEWDFPGGKADDNETPDQTARRETKEEIGYDASGDMKAISHTPDTEGVEFITYLMAVPEKFKPKLEEGEHTDWKWCRLDNPPEPLHPGVRNVIDDLMEKMEPQKAVAAGDSKPDFMAFDDSMRTIDQDGRLHVELSNISKANICPYYGNEIPDWQELGLQPDKVYQLLRDPNELKKAAASFNNLPVIDAYDQTGSEHIPVSADDPKKHIIVGSTGTDGAFNSPYMTNSIVIWDSKTIKGIDNKKRKEISCAYYYKADMKPGTYEGMRYDGVMRDIRGNHVAIVAAGRAGPDVAVGDSKLMEKSKMSKRALSKKAALAKGALIALNPKLAGDAKLNLNKILADVTSKNWAEKKPEILVAIKSKLANDADMDTLINLIDKLDDGPDTGMDVEPDDDMSTDSPMDALCQALKGMLSPEDYAKVEPMLTGLNVAGDKKDEKAEDEKDDDAVPPAGATDDPPPFKGKPETGAAPVNPVGEKKSAMDAAMIDAKIKAAVKDAEAKTIKRMRDISEAEAAVGPYVGKLTAADSAEGVYRMALTTMGIDITDIHPSAYKAVLMAHPKPGINRESLAADSASTTIDMSAAFPNAARLTHR